MANRGLPSRRSVGCSTAVCALLPWRNFLRSVYLPLRSLSTSSWTFGRTTLPRCCIRAVQSVYLNMCACVLVCIDGHCKTRVRTHTSKCMCTHTYAYIRILLDICHIHISIHIIYVNMYNIFIFIYTHENMLQTYTHV